MRAMDTVLVPIHREGHIFILIFAIITALLFAVEDVLGWMGVLATCWCTYFFRDPDRVTPQKAGLVIATGDGVVSEIAQAPLPPELGMGEETRTRVSIFLNVFNVHVNRIPVEGKITKLHYHPGKFFNASLDKASIHNERHSGCVVTPEGKEVVFVQIAGLVARRIVNYLKEEQEVVTGERYGLIRFGSRCDIFLPGGVNPQVAVGQQTVGGETVIADLSSTAEAITGVKH